MTSTRPPRYRVVVYELHDENTTKIMDATANAFIAAIGSIQNGIIDGELGDGGPHDLQQHLALLINSQYRP
jgi:hypothetical protein